MNCVRIASLPLCLLTALGVRAQTLRPVPFDVEPGEHVTYYLEEDENFFHLVLESSDLESFRPIAVSLGETAPGELRAALSGKARQAFFRLETYPRGSMLDTDGDGLPDVYELERAGLLDALDPSDAALDPDADGFSNLSDYRNRAPNLEEPLLATVEVAGTLRLQLAGSDPDGDELRFGVLPQPLPGGATLNPATGEFNFVPTIAEVGVHELTFTVSDGRLQDRKTATFTVPAPPAAATTSLSGRLLDAQAKAADGSDVAIVGATVSLLGTGVSATSDNDGFFVLSDVPAGVQVFSVLTDTAQDGPGGARYARFRERLGIQPGVSNVIERPVYLPRIAAESLTTVAPDAETVVVNPTLGISLLVPPRTAKIEGGPEDFEGDLSISLVPRGLEPMALPENLQPETLITIQPVGVTFADPVAVTFPNTEGFAPGNEVDIWSLDPVTGQFAVVGRGRVTADGSRIETVSGGVRAAEWHFILSPSATTQSANGAGGSNTDPNRGCVPGGSSFSLASGNLMTDVATPATVSMGVERALRLVYNSTQAFACPITPFDATISRLSAVPRLISYQVRLGRTTVTDEVFIDTSGFNEGADESFRAAAAFEATGLPTGAYPYDVRVVNHFAQSTVGTVLTDRTLVVNRRDSPFGAGWGLAGLKRIHRQSNGDAMLVEGGGKALLFELDREASIERESPFVTGAALPLRSLDETLDPRSLAKGDFNADGNLDVAVGNERNAPGRGSGWYISILEGRGDGTFREPVDLPLPAGDNAFSLVAADFNGDGRPDLAAGSNSSARLLVALAQGRGFGPFEAIDLPDTGGGGLEAGFVNGDAFLDLVVFSPAADSAFILTGQGDGTFAGPTTRGGFARAARGTLVDVSGDGRPDLVAGGFGTGIDVALNGGTGAFGAPLAHDLPITDSLTLNVDDFTGDGLPDILTAGRGGATLLRGTGGGSFAAATPPDQIPVAGIGSSNGAAHEQVDLDGDGNGDAFFVTGLDSDSRSNVLNVLYANGDGSFESRAWVASPGGGGETDFVDGVRGRTALAGDFNNDGVSDIVTAQLGSDHRGNVAILLGIGPREFSSPRIYRANGDRNFKRSSVVGDFNNDGTLDMVTLTHLLDFLAGNGDGTFQPPVRVKNPSNEFYANIAAADFDDDGKLDVAWLGVGGVQGGPGPRYRIAYGRGDGSFESEQTFDSGGARRIVTADFNNDGRPDVAGRLDPAFGQGSNGVFDVYLKDPAGRGFAAAPISSALGPGASEEDGYAVADWDRDGNLDFVTYRRANGFTGGEDRLLFLPGNGDGSFQPAVTITPSRVDDLKPADVNRDGLLDLLGTGGGSVKWWTGDGRGNFFGPLTAGGRPLGATVNPGHFNDDRMPDFAVGGVPNFSQGGFGLLLSDRVPVKSDNPVIPVAVGSRRVDHSHVADLDGDGLDDMVVEIDGIDDRHHLTVLLQREREPDGPVVETPEIFRTPRGEFSDLEKNAHGGYTRSFPNGSREYFDAEGLLTSVEDRNGNVTTYEYDQLGRPIRITDPVGRVFTLSYRGLRLKEITGPAGRVTRFHHDVLGNLIRVVFPDRTERRYTYDNRHLLLGETDEAGFTTLHEYDAASRVNRAILPDGTERSLTPARTVGVPPADAGSIDKPVQPRRVDESVATYRDTDGQPQTYEIDGLGNDTTHTDAAGHVTTLERDSDGNITRAVFPSGHTLRMSYDSRGNRSEIVDETVGGITRIDYDPLFSRTVAITNPSNETIRLTLDDRGNTVGVESPGGISFAYAYDERGLLARVIRPEGAIQSYSRDASGNIVGHRITDGGSSRVAAIGRTLVGYISSVDVGDLLATATNYDDRGRPVELRRAPDASVERFRYSESGLLTSLITSENNVHRFTYNGREQLESYEAPPVDGTSFVTDFENRQGGDELIVTPPLGAPGYTILSNPDETLASVTVARGQWTFDYDPATGQLASARSPDGVAESYSYLGELLIRNTWQGAIQGSVEMQPNADYSLERMTVNSLTPITFAYDRNDNRIRAGDLDIPRDPNTGRVTRTEIGLLTDQTDHNDFGEVTAYEAAFDGTAGFSNTYGYDDLSRIVMRTETIGGVTSSYTYEYDMLGRLSKVTREGVTSERYTYDGNGNRLGDGSDAYTYDAQDRLRMRGDATYSYDGAGFVQSISQNGQETHYEYDSVGNLLAVELPDTTRITYLVDAQSRRVAKRLNGANTLGFLYGDALRPVAQLDGDNQVVAQFIYGRDTNSPDYMIRGGNRFRLVKDHVGSVRLVVDVDTGAIAQRLDYNSFGRVLLDTNPGFQPFGFGGGLYDPDTGLVRFGARDYDPVAGRWMAKDPIRFAGGDFNLYAYAFNDPINRVDVDGLESTAAYPVAYLLSLEGDGAVYIQRAGRRSFERAKPDDNLYLGDRVITAEGSMATIQFDIGGQAGVNDGETVLIADEREVEPDPLRSNRESTEGSWWYIDPNRNTEKNLQVQTSGGIMGMKGG